MRLAPCSRSVAWPSATSLLASMRQMSLTTPPHWSANAVMLPTRPPPPMMLTFMWSVSKVLLPSPRRGEGARDLPACPIQPRHHLIGDRLHQFLDVAGRLSV